MIRHVGRHGVSGNQLDVVHTSRAVDSSAEREFYSKRKMLGGGDKGERMLFILRNVNKCEPDAGAEVCEEPVEVTASGKEPTERGYYPLPVGSLSEYFDEQ